MRLNSLPTMTWNFLRLNDIEAAGPVSPFDVSGIEVDIKNIPEGVEVSSTGRREKDIPGGMGKEAEAFFEENTTKDLYIRVLKGTLVNSPLRVDFDYSKAACGAVRVFIEAEAGSSVDIILNQLSGPGQGRFAGLDVKADLKSSARLKLVNTNLLSPDDTYFENIGAHTEDRALFGLIQMELGAAKTYMGVNVDLKGYRSEYNGNAGYLTRNEELLDMNYMINHIGRKSVSSLMVKGALKDRAVKNFRGTIDLRRGAKGAVGDEQEETLLLSEGVKNKTLPIILCDEEDVEGTHGASIGRLSEDVLFYMTSRGISESEAELLMTRAKLDSIRRLIGDEESQGRIQHWLETSL